MERLPGLQGDDQTPGIFQDYIHGRGGLIGLGIHTPQRHFSGMIAQTACQGIQVIAIGAAGHQDIQFPLSGRKHFAQQLVEGGGAFPPADQDGVARWGLDQHRPFFVQKGEVQIPVRCTQHPAPGQHDQPGYHQQPELGSQSFFQGQLLLGFGNQGEKEQQAIKT